MIQAVQERQRAKNEALRLAAAEKALGEREEQQAREAAAQHIVERRLALHVAIVELLEDEAIALIQADDTPSVVLCKGDEQGWTPLHHAASGGLSDCCTAFMKRDDFTAKDAGNSFGQTALHIAASQNRARACTALLEAGCDANIRDERSWTAADYAHAWGLSEAAAVMMESATDAYLSHLSMPPPVEEPPPLYELHDREALLDALETGRVNDASVIIKDNDWFYVNEKDKRKRTALHLAARKGHADLCAAILARQDFLKANDRDQDRCSALHCAVANRRTAASLAILASSKFTAAGLGDLSDQTGLHLAAQRRDEEVCKAILFRISPDAARAVDKNGNTALEYAEENSLVDVVDAINLLIGEKS